METISVELKVLIECLKKKETALQQIVNITENQGFVLTSNMPHEEIYPFFMQMNDEKQTLIDRILQCDQVFENVMQKVGATLDASPSQYGEEVQTIQDLIRCIMDLDVRVRLEEQNNHKTLLEALPQGGMSEEALEAISQENIPQEVRDILLKGNQSALPQEGQSSGKQPVIGGGKHADDKVRKAYENQSRHFKN